MIRLFYSLATDTRNPRLFLEKEVTLRRFLIMST